MGRTPHVNPHEQKRKKSQAASCGRQSDRLHPFFEMASPSGQADNLHATPTPRPEANQLTETCDGVQPADGPPYPAAVLEQLLDIVAGCVEDVGHCRCGVASTVKVALAAPWPPLIFFVLVFCCCCY